MVRILLGTLAATVMVLGLSSGSIAATVMHPNRGDGRIARVNAQHADYWNHHRYHHRDWDRHHHRWHYYD